MTHDLTKEQIVEIRRRLLRWFDRNRRNLPWRHTQDPYSIWIAEIMLQQTRVETVIPFFLRFLKRFPDLRSLADSTEQEVLKLWEGLGYYSRARNLRKAARQIFETFDGSWPKSPQEWRKLPGIGVYTAGAICSQAFDQQVAAVDGNVLRVFSRLLEYETILEPSRARKEFTPLIEQCLPEKRPGDFNQALMELGATICTPRTPRCSECPLRRFCRAFASGKQQILPRRSPRQSIPHYNIGAGLVWRDGKLLITRRPSAGLLGGLWEFPGGKQEPGEAIENTISRELEEELGIRVSVGEEFMSVNHAYSHFKITLFVHHCRWLAGEPVCRACSEFRWIDVESLQRFPFPGANKRIIEKLLTLPVQSLKKIG